MNNPAKLNPGETLDVILGDSLKLIQRGNGYRFSIDALLLAAFLEAKKGERAAELGTGSGVIALIAAGYLPVREVVAIELQAALADLAGRNTLLNGLNERVRVVRGDLKKIHRLAERESFDLVFCNPPFRSAREGRINPDPEKAIARHQLRAGLREFLGASFFLLRNSGRLCLIYPAAKLAELVFELRRKRLEIKRLRMVHSRKESPGVLVLAEARKGVGMELEILPPLYLFQGRGKYTREAREIVSGGYFRRWARQLKFPHPPFGKGG
ncbi:MAG: methyltransferase [bacterium]|nr:methyltransferase [bacterium]